MPINNINLGSVANDGTGDSARLAGQKINGNFAYLETLIANNSKIRENTYGNIAALLADQDEQTEGRLQFVSDASADIDVESGYAYYEKLETSTSDLEDDYRKLSDSEAAIAETGMINKFRITELSTTATTSVASGLVNVQYENSGNTVVSILFPQDFSQYLSGMKANDSLYDFSISIFNRSQNVGIGEASIDFTVVNTNYVKVTTQQGLIPYPNLAPGDIIDVYFDGYKVSAGASGTTQIINLGTHTSTTVEAVFNAAAEFTVQDKTVGLRLVNITIDTVELQYFFTGVGGDYGTGGDLTALDTDFSLISGDVEIEIVIPTENQIKGKRLTATVSGTYNIDLSTDSDFHLTMSADTAFTFTNTPTGTEVSRCKLRLTGEFAATWTQGGLQIFGDDYDGTKWNDILVEMWLDGTIKGLLIYQQRETA